LWVRGLGTVDVEKKDSVILDKNLQMEKVEKYGLRADKDVR
jgi:hypothetical protein